MSRARTLLIALTVAASLVSSGAAAVSSTGEQEVVAGICCYMK